MKKQKNNKSSQTPNPAEMAEEELLKLVKSGHAPSIKFFLETKGKHLGYERKNTSGEEAENSAPSPEEMMKRFDALLGLLPRPEPAQPEKAGKTTPGKTTKKRPSRKRTPKKREK